MNLLETANNAFLAVIAAPEAIRELRAYGAEEMDREGICQAMLRYRARAEELEIDIRKLREFNHGLALEGEKFKARIAELESELATLRAKTETAIPEPDPGEGFELIDTDTARNDPLAEYQTWYEDSRRWDGNWDPVMECIFDASIIYTFRRPIAKPAPQWVACTAEEATKLRDAERLDRGAWVRANPTAENALWHSPDYAYRTTAALSEWVRVDSATLARLSKAPIEWRLLTTGDIGGPGELKRSTVPVGTVLG